MTRLARVWAALDSEQRLAAVTALALVATMFFPWYSKTDTVLVGNSVKATQTSLSGIGAMSFVEAAVLLVALAVLALLFARGEGRDFHMPGSDGAMVVLAGGWVALLIFFRMLDKPGLSGTQRITATVGIQWGIFFALAAACLLTYAGWRMRGARRPEPPLVRGSTLRRPPPDEDITTIAPLPHREARVDPVPARPPNPAASASPRRSVTTTSPASDSDALPTYASQPTESAPLPPAPPIETGRPPKRRRPRYPPAPSDQLSFDDVHDERE